MLLMDEVNGMQEVYARYSARHSIGGSAISTPKWTLVNCKIYLQELDI
jgi:hypothetical protein